VLAGTGSITQSIDSLFTAASGDIRLLAALDVTVGTILTNANVAITATAGSVVDADPLVAGSNDTRVDITAAGLRVNAGVGIGANVNHLETTVGTLTARATSGGVYVSETDGLIVGDVSVTIQRVGSNAGVTATTDAIQSDVITTAGNGNIVLATGAGSIVLNDGTASADDIAISANGSGNILILALGAGTDVTANADILSGTGHITVLAAGSVRFTNTADVRTTGAGTVDVEAGAGSITQSTTSVIGAAGDIRLLAGQDVTIGLVTTTTNVSITATAGSINDADALVNGANDGNLDVVASGLRLVAGLGIGATVNHLDTTVGTLTARATSGGVYVSETDGLIVGDVSVTIQRVGSDAGVTATVDATQSDIRTIAGNGNIVLVTAAGNIVLNDGTATADDIAIAANGSGNILILANGAGTDVTANADLVSGTGHITVLAANAVIFTGTADIRTSGAGTLDIEAGTGSITQSATGVFEAASDIRLLAATDITLGLVSSAASVSITATAGSILDADALVNGANDGNADIIAAGLRMQAGLGIGGAINHLDTTVGTLTARATSGGVYVKESDDLIIGDVSATIQRVGSDAGTTATVDALQSDVMTTAGNGNIVLSAGGSIVLNDGTASADDIAVSANGSGNVLILTLGPVADVTANADILSGTGHVTIVASQ